jgi:hypothetical protein
MSKLISSRSLAAAVVALALAIPMAAMAQGTSMTTKSFSAVFYLDDPGGCLITSVSHSQVVQTRPKPSTIQDASFVQIWRDLEGRDCATAAGGGSVASILEGISDQPPTEFTIDQRLTNATLKVTIPITFQETGAEASVVVNLITNGVVGQLTPLRSHVTFPGSQPGPVIMHTSEYSRPGMSSGSIFVGTIDYAGTLAGPNSSMSVQTQQSAGPKPRLLH